MNANDKIQSRGFTTFELMVAALILSILAALTLPAIGSYQEKRRLIGAAEEIYSQLQFARSEALKQSDSINVNFALTGASPSTSWNFGISTSSCNPNITDATAAGACILTINGTDVLKRTSSTGFADISMATPNFSAITVDGVATQETGFEPIRGTVADSTGALANGTVILTSPNYEIRVVVSPIGRIRIYSPAGLNHISGYPIV